MEIDGEALLGQQVGPYRLVEVLGSGGFACVYRGRWGTGQEVAIKISRRSLDSLESREDFEREVRIISRLSHPNIIRLLDYGIYEVELHGQWLALPYLVMPLAPGGSLRQLVPRGRRLPLEEVVRYVQQVAAALQYAHDFREPDGRENAILHLDVKPANMLIGERGQIWLSDFGIAIIGHKTLRVSDPLAAAQSVGNTAVWGSPEYMAPERFEGLRRRASDQYALAVTCYEWLAGAPPFSSAAPDLQARQQELRRLHQTQPPPPLTARFGDIPPAVERVIFKALAKDPDQRYPTVKAFAEALEQAVSEQRRPPQPEPGHEPAAASRSAPGFTPAFTPGPVPAKLFLGGRSFSPGGSLASTTLPNLPTHSSAALLGPAFSLKSPPAKPPHLFSGHRSFLYLPEFRLFRFTHFVLIILAGILLLTALRGLWWLILLSIPLMMALFLLAISRRQPLVAQALGLLVACYYGLSGWVWAYRFIAHVGGDRLLGGVIASLLALAACAACLYANYRYVKLRLRW
uniref:non-specific serine/threonine protein kinase n=1 Tax=Thermogemmatispora argillosa TaxID=2045280 RepID=A0A455SZZ9_9CHLR|nr:hypothetical protein KTA_13450 [Thermogemmatispora argillosa]